MFDQEYQLSYFKDNGFTRKKCLKCGEHFWTRNAERETCGDASCDEYSFIGAPAFSKSYNLTEMREAFLSFFEANDHTRIDRYPVIARWRDDIYLTIASIADFQPFVTSGAVPPPANPLCISQPCIRLDDLDSVGKSGRHLTNFEMMAHHAFNDQDNRVYWKEETVEYCDQLLSKLGLLSDVTYKEEPWAGGGNAGPCLEVIVDGLELATLVFMDMRESKDGDITIKGKQYVKMDNSIVDTGYGLERFVWASQGSPTIYDAVFPEMVSKVTEYAGIEHSLHDPEYAEVLAQNARLSGRFDLGMTTDLDQLRNSVAKEIGIDVKRLKSIIEPVEKVYAIVDHSRCLAFMLGDGIVPSNVKAGYLARLVIRRMLRLMDATKLDISISELVEMQINQISDPAYAHRSQTIREILDLEETKYKQVISKGRRLIERSVKKIEHAGVIPTSQLIEWYDTHGIPPEIAKEVADAEKTAIDLPDNFYSMVASTHTAAVAAEAEAETLYQDRIKLVPPTKLLFYDEPENVSFEAVVLEVCDGHIVLDQTLFYPEGGGQPADHGVLSTADAVLHVTDVQSVAGVVLHEIDELDGGEVNPMRRGDLVIGRIDSKRRFAHAQHHTATHIVNNCAKIVLGDHIWQTGAQKSETKARLDITHFKRIADHEFTEIEQLANKEVAKNRHVHTTWMDRVDAEKEYGFALYQGGVPPGEKIRVVRVGGDVEACAGTHLPFTGMVGQIKLLHTERIQDGVERIEFAAGNAAVIASQERDHILKQACSILRVPPEKLASAADRFFTEWKELSKQNTRLKEELASAIRDNMVASARSAGNIRIASYISSHADMQELIKIAGSLRGIPDMVALIGSTNNSGKVVVSVGKDAQASGLDAGAIVRRICEKLGGSGGGKPEMAQGGGPDAGKLSEAFDAEIGLITGCD
ncbi:MAG: alanine--tRNA ligase [Methanosarcinales archaeon]|nr:MAG: alanine--tRNA ligase [Methanosarcinales archaeon]